MKKTIFMTLILAITLNINVLANQNTNSKLIESNIIKSTDVNNEQVTKAGLVIMINNVLNYNKDTIDITNTKSFLDCEQKWYDEHFKVAYTAGYILGDDKKMANPEHMLSRQEACVIIAKAFYVKPLAQNIIFKDDEQILPWAKPFVNNMWEKGYLKDIWTTELMPNKRVTNTEVFDILSKIIGTPIIKQPTLSVFEGNVTVFSKNINLLNTTINGDLIILPSASDIKLDNLNITGDLKYIN